MQSAPTGKDVQYDVAQLSKHVLSSTEADMLTLKRLVRDMKRTSAGVLQLRAGHCELELGGTGIGSETD